MDDDFGMGLAIGMIATLVVLGALGAMNDIKIYKTDTLINKGVAAYNQKTGNLELIPRE